MTDDRRDSSPLSGLTGWDNRLRPRNATRAAWVFHVGTGAPGHSRNALLRQGPHAANAADAPRHRRSATRRTNDQCASPGYRRDRRRRGAGHRCARGAGRGGVRRRTGESCRSSGRRRHRDRRQRAGPTRTLQTESADLRRRRARRALRQPPPRASTSICRSRAVVC